ncbi:hypothetical protein LSF60_16440 [Rhodococcus pyridinivorans]|uniref:hypothetical protein n=1 Tax=Rhodococcus pyridinivorans TaxID=103816 RepID=UPI001E5249E6|nr:hypothetical protein [Rhodococcus pyridinivorans]UGQ56893.1 hypothetical protein LSF60_16440 [Rhodococcus pyridinivorans]
MSRTRKAKAGKARRERSIAIRTIRRQPPDLRKLSRAVIAQALAEAEAEAAAQAIAAADQAPSAENMPSHEVSDEE